MWLPLPQSDEFQTVEMIDAESPVSWKVLDEKRYGNKVIFMKLAPRHAGKKIRFTYNVHRLEKSAYPAEQDNLDRYLEPARLVPTDDQFQRIAAQVLEDKTGEMVRARALYDHVSDQMRYAKFDDQYGRGDARYACDARTGNCTDYHSYFIALARAADIPARFAIGAPVPSSRNEGGITGYHCWAEFYANGKWWPVDISESDKFTALSTYYFGHHPANRIEFTRGRDLVVEPGPQSGPINFLAYPLLEVNGQLQSIKPFFSFTRPTGKADDQLAAQ
jgi:transglutaminase-like putative cysteine protease